MDGKPTSESSSIVRLKSGLKINAIDPQCVECVLDSSFSAVLEDNKTYMLAYPPEAEQKDWNGGITWWKLVSNPRSSPNPSLSSDQPPLRVKKSPLPTFRAMSSPPRPPKIEYELDVQPNRLDITADVRLAITVKFRLLEATRHTVMTTHSHSSPGPKTNALGFSNIGSFSFDIVDATTDDILTAIPMHNNSPFSSRLARPSIRKHQLRELEPGVTYTSRAELSLHDKPNPVTTFCSYFRFPDVENYRGRKLGVKLRPVQTFWSEKGIDELFAHSETIRPDQWYIPLTIESPAIADFLVEK